jgi:F-type H+-transporting ATPase subunit b
VPASSHLLAASSSGSFLITPGLGLMVWTLVVFIITMLLLRRFAFPAIRTALDRRQKSIEDAIDTAERTRVEADALLAEYRERLKEARGQAEEIVTRARRAAEEQEHEAIEAARERREQLLEQTKRDIEVETRRAIAEIRDEVTNLTILATEKVTRKTLSSEDQRRLVEEAIGELDFASLSGSEN